MKIGLSSLLLVATMLASGCAASPAEDTSASDAMLTTVTPLDRVTPAEVADAFAASVKEGLAACTAAHPEITVVDRTNLSRFHVVGVTSYFQVAYAVEALLDDTGASSIAPAAVAARIGPWAASTLAGHVDASGFFTGDVDRFYSAELAAREAKAHAIAKAPGGKSLSDIRALWREVERAKNTLDSSWLRPVKVSGEPSLGEIRTTMHIPYDVDLEAWGDAAVDEFAEAPEGPDRTPAFAPLASFLKSDAIKKRWLFQAYDHSGSTNVLVVLDEHDQLWGMQMGYSE